MAGADCLNVIKALVVRAALTLHTLLTVWRVTENLDDQKYWLLCLLMVPFFIEGLYSVLRRRGKEYLWFSPCFFLYLCATLPPIWLLELDKSKQVREEEAQNGTVSIDTSTSENHTSEGPIDVPIDLNPNMWTIVIEEMLLYLLVVGRWILPRGEVTREQLSELLFAFIGIAADVMEFFSLFGENDVRKDEVLGYCLLGIWTLSILQFTMAVTVTQQPKRARKIKVVKNASDNTSDEDRHKMRNELGAIFVSMIMQDLPFLVVRLYTIITYNLINYSLIFFTSKNVLVIALLFYKVAVILQKAYCPGPEDGSGDKEVLEQDDDGFGMKYALDYEYAGVSPPASKHHGSTELTQRKVSKESKASNPKQPPSNQSTPNRQGDTRRSPPNGHATRAEAQLREQGPSDSTSPHISSSSSAQSSPAAANSSSPTPRTDTESASPSTPGSEKTPSIDRIGGENAEQLPRDAPKEAPNPVVYSPTKQDAKPGDPNFKPYVSVVKIQPVEINTVTIFPVTPTGKNGDIIWLAVYVYRTIGKLNKPWHAHFWKIRPAAAMRILLFV